MKKLNEQEMATYVAERIELVSDKKRAEFDALTVEEQYKKIKSIEAAKRFAEKKKSGAVAAKSGLIGKVENILIKSHVSVEDIDNLICFLDEYKKTIVENQIKSLDEQISELQAKRDELMK